MSKIILSLFTVFILVSSVGYFYEKAPEPVCNFVQNKSKQRVSWGNNFPIKFKVHSSVPYDALESIRKAAQVWNSISKKDLIHIVDVHSDARFSMYDKINGIYWSETWSKHNEKEQARTTIRWKKNTAISADIIVNNKNFEFFFMDQESSMDKVDFLGMMVHEFGHALGLAHVSHHHLSVMYPVLPKGLERRMNNNFNILHDVDLKSFKCEYAELFDEPNDSLEHKVVEKEDHESHINSSSHSL